MEYVTRNAYVFPTKYMVVGANIRHIHKYTKVYEEIYPTAVQVLIANPSWWWWVPDWRRVRCPFCLNSLIPVAHLLSETVACPRHTHPTITWCRPRQWFCSQFRTLPSYSLSRFLQRWILHANNPGRHTFLVLSVPAQERDQCPHT